MKRIHWAVLGLAVSIGVCAAEQERVANEGTIGDKWMLAEGATLAMATYPAPFADTGADVCMAIGYRIGPDGATSGFTVLKQWNSQTGEDELEPGFWQAFAQAGADALAQWRFQPRPGVGQPVPTFTVSTMGFKGRSTSDLGQVTAHCRIGDLAKHLEAMKAGSRHGDMVEHQIDRQRSRDVELRRQREIRQANRSN